MAADKKQNRKSPSEETIKALGNSIDECWNELNNLPPKRVPACSGWRNHIFHVE